MAATAWTNDPATSKTHVRTIHINELRQSVDFYRTQAGLPAMSWTDHPVTTSTHIRAVHFTELRSAIQDVWNAQSLGGLPAWSVGSPPVPSRHISARDMNDLRSWVNTLDPPLHIWSGFHWCSPVCFTNRPDCSNPFGTQSSNQVAQQLLQESGRWGTVIILSPTEPGNVQPDFKDAVDRVNETVTGLGGPGLGQSVVRLYFPSQLVINSPGQPNNISNVDDAKNWIQAQGFDTGLQYFIDNGGENVVLFNELNVQGEPQRNIDPRIMGYLSLGLQALFPAASGGVRPLYVLFPGPGGQALTDPIQWRSYWDQYDLRDSATHTPQTFDAFYTECGGQCPAGGTCSDNTSCFGDSACAGAALADFQANADFLFGPGNRQGNPGLLRAIYGYILDYSNDAATVTGQYAIGNRSSSPPYSGSSNYLTGYTSERQRLGFG